MSDFEFEKLSDTIEICISTEHRFGTDAFLLADFANPRRKDKVCDLCTGSGIVALLMKRNNNPANIIGVDIQEKAIEQFNISIERSKLDNMEAICADLKTLWDNAPDRNLDVVTCNPPYKIDNTGAKNDLDAVTIARHEVLCNIENVCEASSKLLKFGGRLCICNRPERLADVILAMKKFDIEPKRLRFVSKTPTTAPWLFLIEGKKGSKPYMKVEPALFVQGENGFSDELMKIYGKVVQE